MKKLGIYIHIPFCRQRCLYCGFHSNATGEGAGGRQAMAAYVQWLIGQIMEKGKQYRKQYTVDTVFIGGGTPSMLSAAAVEAILGAVRESFVLESEAEITIEANPDSLDAGKLKRYLGAGINRLSMGVQSFDDGLLQTLGRVHDAAEAETKFRLARRVGFRNINLDLMFAIPGQTKEQWRQTLETALRLEPEHISFYAVQIEEDTPFYDAYLEGTLPLVPEEEDRAMYHEAIHLLGEKGYKHYEISNAAREGMECRHNLKYWTFQEYLGIGDSASSFMNGVRTTEKPREEYHENDMEDNTAEFVFTGLRLTEGIRKSEFQARFGRPFWEVYGSRRARLEEFFGSGALIEEGDVLRLSEHGIDISNQIMSLFV